MEKGSRKLKDHPDVPGESRMEGTRANLGIKIGPDVAVGSVQGSPKRSVNIHCDPNWWARLFHGDSSCSCIGHYSDESGDKWQEDAMELKWGTVCETLEWENRELDEMSQEGRAHRDQKHRWIKCSV